ncbi:hypothetical protein CANINC_003640 [Pichia inconspicua]|uniref:C2H2-type domain-containing protein n=1 Tax=Pichia inconspicua TaxID=52247 RepID=A0A4T0WY74_9ASCO|nr:hypothetical protein CANINC_003640 [[Candida] inconspicua]
MTTIKCEWSDCKRVFTTDAQLYAHVCTDHVGRRANRNLQLTCRWARCGRTFRKRDHVTSHCKVHLNHKPYRCTAPQCSKAFKRAQDLKKHARVHSLTLNTNTTTTTTTSTSTITTPITDHNLRITTTLPSPPGNNYTFAASPVQLSNSANCKPIRMQMQIPMPMSISMPASMSMSMPMSMPMSLTMPMTNMQMPAIQLLHTMQQPNHYQMPIPIPPMAQLPHLQSTQQHFTAFTPRQPFP